MLVAVAGLAAAAACGGDSFSSDDGSGGSGGSSGSAGAGGTSGSGGSGGSSGSGGSGGSGASSCTGPSECVVVPESCCGQCGAATPGDAIAVHVDDTSSFRQQACGEDSGCPACFMPSDPFLIATCEQNRCVLVNLSTHPITQCAKADDCVLRTRDCCPCGGDQSESGLIAISREEAQRLEQLVCGPMQACPECEPLPPDNAKAVCKMGRCGVEWFF